MDELSVSDIDAQMGNPRGVGVGKEDQIAGLQGSFGNGSSCCPLLLAGSGQGKAVLGINILHKARAVKAARCAAAPDIGNTQILLGGGNDTAAGGRRRLQRRGAGSHAGGFAAHKEEWLIGRVCICRNAR